LHGTEEYFVLDNLIFSKTELGKQEIQYRRIGLSNTIRLILVLIDGRRDVRTLLALSETLAKDPNCLESLMQQGLIEVTGESDIDAVPFAPIAAPSALRAPNTAEMAHRVPNTAQMNPSLVALANEPIGKSFALANEPTGNFAPSSARPSAQENAQLMRAKQVLMNELKQGIGADSETACLRVMQSDSVETLLVLLPKLTDLLALYTTRQQGLRVHDGVRDLLLM
jgi:hypothetical protein